MYEPIYRVVRPSDIEEVVGQSHLLAPGAPLRVLIERGEFPSMLFYGPPGTGKTLVAEIMAHRIKANFVKLSAVKAGTQDVRKVAQEAEELKKWGKDTVLFLDEIHRFNRAQQDVLLPYIEEGTLVLVGASTENPIFALNKALVSRLMVFEFKPLSEEELKEILLRALKKLGKEGLLSDDALSLIVSRAGGDARKALSMLELVLKANPEGETITDAQVQRALGETTYLRYNRDEHYNVISAFIKSVRGSDPDAALYWLAVMLEAGEDPLYITRRLMILAAEDIGMADPAAIMVATSAHDAVSQVGMPEGELILAFATVYLATAPKSNSCYLAIRRAREWVKRHPNVKVPEHLMDSHAWEKRSSKERYLYPHDYPEGFVRQRYMPWEEVFYIPKELGREAKVAEKLKKLWGERYPEKRDAEGKR